MLLKTYLGSKGLSISEAARQLGINNETFRKWVQGERVPRAAAIRSVMKWSGGLVTANDFCGCAPADSAAQGNQDA